MKFIVNIFLYIVKFIILVKGERVLLWGFFLNLFLEDVWYLELGNYNIFGSENIIIFCL